MKPTLIDLSHVTEAVQGFCERFEIPITIYHETFPDGNTLSRFRIPSQYNDSVGIRWEDASYTRLDDVIANVCKGIYTNYERTRFDNIDISKELEMLRTGKLPQKKTKSNPYEITRVIFNPPATIVFWADRTKTVVKCQEGDVFDPEKGLAMAFVKKMNGNTGKYCDIFKKHIPDYTKIEKNTEVIVAQYAHEFPDRILHMQTVYRCTTPDNTVCIGFDDNSFIAYTYKPESGPKDTPKRSGRYPWGQEGKE